jgi:UDP-N-acetylmuramate--alanine ligase
VAEACEYRRSFLDLRPSLAVVTCIEEEHLDYFRDLEDIVQAFASFAGTVAPDGVVVAPGDDDTVRRAVGKPAARCVWFGLSGACDVRAAEPTRGEDGCWRFRLVSPGGATADLALAVPGMHNVRNALAAAAALSELGPGWDAIAEGLSAFRGVARRFEVLGTWGGVTLVDDYAHHPTEISATLDAARERFPGRRILCAFQPHQHSRTRAFREPFARSLLGADQVLLADIYRVRDSDGDVASVRSADLADRVCALGGRAEHVGGLDAVAEEIARRATAGDVVLTMGAGDIWRARDGIRRRLGGSGHS